MYESIKERAEKLEAIPVLDSRCELAYVQPRGQAAVLSSTFAELLKEAASVYKRQGKLGDKSRYITLDCHDVPGEPAEMTGEIWSKSGEYVQLATKVLVRCDRPFRIAVDLEVLKLTVATAEKATRLDLTVNFDTMVLNMNGGNWQSNFKGLPLLEMQEPIESEPVRMYTKEEQSELNWLKKSLDLKSVRDSMNHAYVASENGHKFAMACNGYTLFVSMRYAQWLDEGWLDLANYGKVDEYSKYVPYKDMVESTTGQRVTVNAKAFIAAIKTAMKVTTTGYINLDFREFVLTVSGESDERGSISTPLPFKQDISAHVMGFDGKLLLNALTGCDLNEVMITFNATDYGPTRFICGKGRAAWIMKRSTK